MLGPCIARLERISLGADGDARGSIEAKKKEALAKRTVKRARRTKKQCVPGRTYRWVENCLETKPSLDAQVFMSNCGSDILAGSRKDNLLDSSRYAYPCLSIAVPARDGHGSPKCSPCLSVVFLMPPGPSVHFRVFFWVASMYVRHTKR